MNFSMGRSGFIPDENFRDRYPYKSDLAYNFRTISQIAVQFPRTWPRGSRVENLGQRTGGEGRKGKKKKEEAEDVSRHRDDEANQVTVVGVTCDATLNPARGVFLETR